MKYVYRIVWNLLVCLITINAAAQVPDEALFPLDELRPGMKGVGKTVFSGTDIEEFEVEILAVLKNSSPHGDIIMAKISGGSPPIEHSGVIAGMSGSPIYIDGKLIGALAFASIFPKEPMVAGITPIHEMIRDATRDHPEGQEQLASLPNVQDTADSLKGVHLAPIHTPLLVSGASYQTLAYLQEQLAPYNMFPAQGGNLTSGLLESEEVRLEPGAALGVQLMQGDLEISAVGTVTHRNGEQILGFGHPLLQAGNINFPMSSAYIHFIMTNQISSFKVASPINTVGIITQDWRTGVSGPLGPGPAMIPFDVTVHNGQNETGRPIHYHFDVVEHAFLTPLLLRVAGLEALLATEKSLGKSTLQTHVTFTFADHPPLSLDDWSANQQSPLAAILEALAPLQVLMGNPFEPVTLERVSLEVTVSDAFQSAEVVRVQIPDNKVRSGKGVEAAITLQPYGDEPLTLTENIMIPEEIHEGPLMLLVCDAQTYRLFESMRAGVRFQPQNLTQLMTLMGEKTSRNTLLTSLFQPRPGAVAQGRELPSPPTSLLAMLTSSTRVAKGRESFTRGQIMAQKQISTQYVLKGCIMVELTIDHRSQPVAADRNTDENPQQGE